MKKFLLLFITISLLSTFTFLSADNKVVYKKEKKDKALKEIWANQKKEDAAKAKITKSILEKISAEKKAKKDAKMTMHSDLSGVYPPKSPKAFKKVFHFEPQAQFMTSTCWSFSATSYYESEIMRLKGEKIKLSEMWTPYFELIEKSRGFIKRRGKSYVAGGGESNGVNRIWKKYGIVPLEDYSGLNSKTKRHNHVPLMRELKSYLSYIKANKLWDEEENLKHVRMILDKHMGTPPSKITYKGKEMTPKEFLKYTGLNMDDYCSVLSTLSKPFYTRCEFDAPDNWWFSKDYINLPLKTWYAVLKKAIRSGYSAIIGGDVSEPGKMGSKDVAFVPDFDIPSKYINQHSREYRIYNKSTQDDHGIHLIGYKKNRGQDWFLIKDSGRSARHGAHNGYYFFSGDFIRLKMLTYTVHKDMLKNILKKIK